MNGEIEEIRELLNYYNTKFDRSHAQIYLCLLTGEVKTVKQIIEESGLCKQTAYKYLKQLGEANLIKKTIANPAQFFIQNPMKELNQFLAQYLKKQTKLIEEKKEKIRQIISNKNDDCEKHWEIKTKASKIAIIDKKENKALTERNQTKPLKEILEKFIQSLPEENKYALAYIRQKR